MAFKLVLEMDIIDVVTGKPFPAQQAKLAWFRRGGQYDCLADTIGDLMLNTALSVPLVDESGTSHDILAQTIRYNTFVMVGRGQPVPFGDLILMGDDSETIDLRERV
jgi:hypothetical protein